MSALPRVRSLPGGRRLPWLVLVLGLGPLGCGDDARAGPGTPPPARELGRVVRVSDDAASLISQRAAGAVEPALTVDTSLASILVYRDDVPTGKGDIMLRVRRPGDAAFGPATNVSRTAAESAAPDVAAGSGLVVSVWAELGDATAGVYIITSGDGGLTLSAPTRISSDVNAAAHPRVGIDAAGQIVVVWEGKEENMTTGAPTRPLWFARSSDGGSTFSAAIALSRIGGLGAPTLALPPSGRIFVAWAEQISAEGGHAVMLVHSDDLGATFSSPAVIAQETLVAPALAADARGKLFLLWAPGSTATGTPQPLGVSLRGSSDDGLTFADIAAPDTSAASDLVLAVNAGGNLWAAWTSCPDQGSCVSRVSTSNDGGATLSPPWQIAHSPVAHSPLRVAALGGASSDVLLIWSGASGWFHDLFSEAFSGAGNASSLAPITEYGATAASEVGADASMPTVATGTEGRILVAWSQDADAAPSAHSGIFFARSDDGGKTFLPPAVVAPNAPAVDFACQREEPGTEVTPTSARVSLAARGPDEIALAWADEVLDPAWSGACALAARPDVFVSRSVDGGRTFSAPVNVSRSSAPSSKPSIGYDAQGGLMLLWEELVEGPIASCSYTSRSQIMTARSEDGLTFSSPLSLSEQAYPLYCGNATDPVLAPAPDSLHATWIIQSAAGTGSTGVVTSRSVDDGATFSPALSVSELPAAGGKTSAVAARATADGAVWFAWRIGDALYVARSLDGAATFDPPELISDAAASDGIGLDATAGPPADTWVTWVTRKAAGMPGDVQLAKPAGAAAATAVNVSSDAGDADWPRVVAVGAGAAVVVWQDTVASSGVSDVLATCRLAP